MSLSRAELYLRQAAAFEEDPEAKAEDLNIAATIANRIRLRGDIFQAPQPGYKESLGENPFDLTPRQLFLFNTLRSAETPLLPQYLRDVLGQAFDTHITQRALIAEISRTKMKIADEYELRSIRGSAHETIGYVVRQKSATEGVPNSSMTPRTRIIFDTLTGTSEPVRKEDIVDAVKKATGEKISWLRLSVHIRWLKTKVSDKYDIVSSRQIIKRKVVMTYQAVPKGSKIPEYQLELPQISADIEKHKALPMGVVFDSGYRETAEPAVAVHTDNHELTNRLAEGLRLSPRSWIIFDALAPSLKKFAPVHSDELLGILKERTGRIISRNHLAGNIISLRREIKDKYVVENINAHAGQGVRAEYILKLKEHAIFPQTNGQTSPEPPAAVSLAKDLIPQKTPEGEPVFVWKRGRSAEKNGDLRAYAPIDTSNLVPGSRVRRIGADETGIYKGVIIIDGKKYVEVDYMNRFFPDRVDSITKVPVEAFSERFTLE